MTTIINESHGTVVFEEGHVANGYCQFDGCCEEATHNTTYLNEVCKKKPGNGRNFVTLETQENVLRFCERHYHRIGRVLKRREVRK